jgi:hypothetical protein
VKWAAAENDSAINTPNTYSPILGAYEGVQPRLTDNAPDASAPDVLPNLTPMSSPTAGALDTATSLCSDSQANSGAMQLSRGAPSEEYSSSSWSEQLAAAPEAGGWSIKSASSVASSTGTSQKPRSRAHMMQLLQQHQQMQQQMQQTQSFSRSQGP